MMIEPPREPLVGTVFEINDRILVSIQLFPVKGIARPMHSGRITDLRIRVDLSAVKFTKDRRRRNAVKTVAVIENSKFHKNRLRLDAKHFRLDYRVHFVKQNLL